MNKETFLYILPLLDLSAGMRSTHIPPILRLAVTLNFLGGGGYQRQVGADWSAPMGQSTVCEVISLTLKQMERKLCPLTIKFDQSASETTKMFFYEKNQIPGGRILFLSKNKLILLLVFFFLNLFRFL